MGKGETKNRLWYDGMKIQLVKADDLLDDLSHSYMAEEQTGEPTGWQELDRYYTVCKGQLTIVTGVPSHGKSEFVDALSINLALKSHWRFLVYSPENYPVTTHIKKLARKYIGKPYGEMYNGTMTKEEAADAIGFISEAYIFVEQTDALVTTDDLIAVSRDLDIDGMIIDPWNEMDHRRPTGMREDEYISLSLGKLRANSRSQNLHTWLIAHPKLPGQGRNYKTQPPGLYDVSGGAHWYNKADNGLTVHRPEVIDGSETNVHVTKIRFRSIGKPTGENPVKLDYNIASGRYSEQ
jgi:twinkle protein